MTGTVEKIKDALHLNKNPDHTTTGASHTTGTTHNTTHGTTNTHTGTLGANNPNTHSTNHGPHDSNILNKADPRVDSDRDGSHNLGGNTTHSGLTGSHGTTNTHTGTTGAYNPTTGSTNHGPHNSNLLNKADPRVDSDRDGSHNVGGGYGSTGIGGHSTNTHTGTTGAYNPTTGSTNHGPHNSNLLNKADPRIDSDRDGSRNLGAAGGTGYSGTQTGNHLPGTHTGTTGGISHSTNAGPHDSNVANKLDPRVDSDLDSTGNRHGAHTGGAFGSSGSHATPGSGTAQNTAGPHNSDLLNKLDPRVDADLDGSKTYGGNRTHQ